MAFAFLCVVVLLLFFPFLITAQQLEVDKKCGTILKNYQNIAHIYANSLPAIFEPPECAVIYRNDEEKASILRSLMFDVARQLNLELGLISFTEFEKLPNRYYRDSLAFYRRGFETVLAAVLNTINNHCSCAHVASIPNHVVIFNRAVSRKLSNYPALVRALEARGVSTKHVFTTNNVDQCWYFCLHREASVVISNYGAEIMYPFLTNTSFLSIAYSPMYDHFLNQALRHFPFDRQVGVVNASIIQEESSDKCREFWKRGVVNYDSRYLYHKCLSLYADHGFIEQTVNMTLAFLSAT